MKLRGPKLLLMFELNQTLMLLYRKRDIIPAGFNNKFYENLKYDEKVGPYQVKYRPGRQEFINTLFLTSDSKIQTAVWSSLGKADTEALAKAYFGRYYRNLLFAISTRRDSYEGTHTTNYNAIPINKELGEVWRQFPDYDGTNSIVISPYSNLVEEYKDNDLIVPSYSPQGEGSGFDTDPGVFAMAKYLRGVLQTMSDMKFDDVRPLIRVKSIKSLFQRVEYNINAPRQFK